MYKNWNVLNAKWGQSQLSTDRFVYRIIMFHWSTHRSICSWNAQILHHVHHRFSAHWCKAHTYAHACGCTYVSSSPTRIDNFLWQGRCMKQTQHKDPRAALDGEVWHLSITKSQWTRPLRFFLHKMFFTPECLESVQMHHVNILSSRFSFSHQYKSGNAIPSRVNYFGNALKTHSFPATQHCIIISQSRGSIHGALCGTGLGNKQVHKYKTMTPQTHTEIHRLP